MSSRSRMFGPGDAVDGIDELAPGVALRGEDVGAGRRQPVEAPAALPGLLDPAALDPPALLQAVQEGIEGCNAERNRAAGAGLDELAQLVTVARLGLEEREDEELGAPLFELAVQHRRLHIRHSNILFKGI